jgi:hypothetical protein
MIPIATATIVGSSTTSFTFSALPQGYTDLVIIKNGSQTGGSNTGLRYNGDSGSNYSVTYLFGNGSTAGTGRDVNTTQMIFDFATTTGNRTMSKIQISNYSNTTTNKTMLWRREEIPNATQLGVGLWRSTAAITSITFIQTVVSSYFSDGTTFTIYGVKAA